MLFQGALYILVTSANKGKIKYAGQNHSLCEGRQLRAHIPVGSDPEVLLGLLLVRSNKPFLHEMNLKRSFRLISSTFCFSRLPCPEYFYTSGENQTDSEPLAAAFRMICHKTNAYLRKRCLEGIFLFAEAIPIR